MLSTGNWAFSIEKLKKRWSCRILMAESCHWPGQLHQKRGCPRICDRGGRVGNHRHRRANGGPTTDKRTNFRL